MTDTKREIEKIINKVRTVEFLHGVPVSLPSETVELLRSGIRGAITQALAEERERVENILDKYYAYQREDGCYRFDPQCSRLIDIIRKDI